MKCPKCNYLGFETGDRCRNCGYDFSLIESDDLLRIETDFKPADAFPASEWPMRAEAALPQAPPVPRPDALPKLRAEPPPVPSAAKDAVGSKRSRDSKLPLFRSASADKGDEPLIKLPVTPRPPLAVRRTPDTPRQRGVPRAVRAVEREPGLEFDEASRRAPEHDDSARTASRRVSRVPMNGAASAPADITRPATRVVAAAIDHLLLGAIDLAVIYFTLRIAGLSMSEWAALPPVPLIFFLLVLKMAYFCAFTAVGGQTIGKMALGIRVVTEDHGSIDAALALRRTVVGVASTVFFGLGFLPAFFDPERRAFHDRVARTRVIALRPA